jgi:DNA-binding protein HU-beta
MTKSEVVEQVAGKAGLTRKQAAEAVDAFLETVEGALKRGTDVTLTGFGKFHVADRAARQGVNPRDPSGAKIAIRARKVPRFSAGASLKAAVDR